MEWIEEVKDKIKRKRSVLFDIDGQPTERIYSELCNADRKAVVIWALDFAEDCAKRLKELGESDADRAISAILLARMWAAGDIKMPQAKRAILDCHAAAKVTTNHEAIALFHAVGQACSTVHTKRHAPGLYVYELTAYVLRYGADDCKEMIEKRIEEYLSTLKDIQTHIDNYGDRWAKFMERS